LIQLFKEIKKEIDLFKIQDCIGQKKMILLHNILVKLLKVIIWITLSLTILFILVALVVQIPAIQNSAVHRATSFISSKTGTRVEIERISITFLGDIAIKGIFVEDLTQDTLLYARQIKLSIAVSGILFKRIAINNIKLNDAVISIHRAPTDSVFNYNFLLTAFSDSTKINADTLQEKPKWSVTAASLVLKNIRVRFNDEFGGVDARINLTKLELARNSIDLVNQVIKVEEFILTESKVQLKTLDKELPTEISKPIIDSISKENSWKICVQRIKFIDNSLAYSVANKPKVNAGFDVNNLVFNHFTLNAADFIFSPECSKIRIKKFAAIDQNGFAVKQLATDFSMDRHSLTANNFRLKTNRSSIEANCAIQFSSLSSIKDSLKNLIVDLDLKNLSVSNSDVLYFNQTLSEQPFFSNSKGATTISGKISGPVNNIIGKSLTITAGSETSVNLDFTLKGLPQVKDAYLFTPNLRIVSGRRDIEQFAGSLIPKPIDLPEKISLLVIFDGLLKSFESTLELSSSYGSAKVMAQIDNAEKFRGNIEVKSFNLGSLLNDTLLLGPISLVAEINGTGLDFNAINANIALQVTEMELKKYTYSNLNLSGKLNGKEVTAKISLNDENAAFDFEGQINLEPDLETFNARLNLKGINLKKVNLVNDDIRIGFVAQANAKGIALDKINGEAKLHNLIVAKEHVIYNLDSLNFTAINELEKSEFNLKSALVDLNYSGTISPIDLVPVTNKFLNRYFPFANSTQQVALREPSSFTFSIQVHNHPILSQVLLPQLNEFEPGDITGSFDSERNELKLNASVKSVLYGSTEIKDLAFDVNSNSEELTYKIHSKTVANANVTLENFLVEGKLANQTIWASISSVDNKMRKKIEVHSQIVKELDNYRVSISPNNFYLMHNQWSVANDNYIEFGSRGILFHNVFLKNDVSEVKIFSVNQKYNDDLSIEVKNFKLDDFSQIIEKDTSLVKGVLDGKVLLKKVNNSYGLVADAQIKELTIQGVPIGNIVLYADNPIPERFNFDVKLYGQQNNLTVKGFVIPKDKSTTISLKADIQSLSMKTIEAFSMGQIAESSGEISGNVMATGSTNDPKILGELVFKNTSTKPVFLNSKIKIDNETIRFKDNGIHLKSFTIVDSHKHVAVIDGSVTMIKFKNPVIALKINTTNFELFDTNDKDSKDFFGRMIIDSRIDIKGPVSNPTISARVKVKEGSNFTFAVPQSKLTTDKGEDVVEFENAEKLNEILYKNENEITSKPYFSGIDLSAIVEIDRKAKLKLLIDPSSSDSLVVKGEAALSFAMDRSGKISLTGAYNLYEGSYLVSLESLVKKRFDILPGSTIVWNGDPLDAEIAINAKYVARAAPYDLLAFQMSSLSDAESSSYKQRYPFWVILKLRGEILHPIINFEIQLPPADKGILGGAVNQKIVLLNDDESAVNKQVFALLVLGRFIQENPLQTESSGTSTLVRATVGKLLSAQLNQLSSRLIPGVELNFDIQSYDDYQSGQAEGRTQVEVGVKKELFNNRLSVQVGGTVDVEGEKAKQNSASDFTSDVKIEYKLTKDGRYRLKGFRHNQYEGAIEGQLVETGVGVAFVHDFDKWKDLFRRQTVQKDSTSITSKK
jgi:hypothetical protein